jgi:L-threonylcarbamoyladenylate synthase
VRSPGQHALHYAPRAELILLTAQEIPGRAAELIAAGKRVVVLSSHPSATAPPDLVYMPLPSSAEELARSLYETLREVDRRGFDVAVVTLPPETGIGLAIADRLRRAAGKG